MTDTDLEDRDPQRSTPAMLRQKGSRPKARTAGSSRSGSSNQIVSINAVAFPTKDNRRVAGLLGYLVKAEVDAIFRQQPFTTPNGEDPLELWRAAEGQRKGLLPLPPGVPSEVPPEFHHLVEDVKRRQTYRRHYESQADYEICSVPIESLVAPQWYADLDYVDDLKKRLGRAPSDENAFRFAFDEGQVHPPVVTANQVQFTSPRLDLYVDPTPVVQMSEDGTFKITVSAGSRPNYIQVAILEGRLVLVNGVHKVCALYALGYKTCFCALRAAARLEDTGLNPQATSLFRDEVFKSARPARVTDFLDPVVATPLHLKAMYQVMQISINAGQIRVPALPAR